MVLKEDRGEEFFFFLILSCIFFGDFFLVWYWRGCWEMAFFCCLLLSRVVGVCSSVIDVLIWDLSLGWYWFGRWVMVFFCGMLLGRVVGVCKFVIVRGLVILVFFLVWYGFGRWVMAFFCWMFLGRVIGVCKLVIIRGVVILEFIFLICIWVEFRVVDGKEFGKFLLTVIDVCICCVVLMDDFFRVFIVFFWFCVDIDFILVVFKFWFRFKREVVFCRFVVCFVVVLLFKYFRLVIGLFLL